MFAVMKTGGKQYKVQAGDLLRVEKLAADAGDKIQFNEILMVGGTVGTPLVEGAAVQADVIDQIKDDKVIHFVRRRRKHSSQRKKGHRQLETVVTIDSILADGKKAPAKKKAAPKKEAAPAAADDLTKMKGLGKVFAGKLEAEGITTFAQIAKMTKADIEALEEKIGAAGKFESNDWVAQAKELAKG